MWTILDRRWGWMECWILVGLQISLLVLTRVLFSIHELALGNARKVVDGLLHLGFRRFLHAGMSSNISSEEGSWLDLFSRIQPFMWLWRSMRDECTFSFVFMKNNTR